MLNPRSTGERIDDRAWSLHDKLNLPERDVARWAAAPAPAQQLRPPRSHHQERHQARNRPDHAERRSDVSPQLLAPPALHAQSIRAGPQATHEDAVYESGSAGDTRKRLEGRFQGQYRKPQPGGQGRLPTGQQRVVRGTERSWHNANGTRFTSTVQVTFLITNNLEICF